MHQQEFVKDLFKKRSDYKDVDQAEMAASLLDTISSDIYSESQRFVFELIQNADDSAYETGNEVNFDFYQKSLVVSHNGQPFSEDDIRSLTSAGSSTKTADSAKTGYKGIGFKSVFGKSDRVTILSQGFQFRFERDYHEKRLPWQVIPIWTELSELPVDSPVESFKKYSVNTIIELEDVDTLAIDLEELLSNAQILLFLRRVTKINVSISGIRSYSIEKQSNVDEKSFNEISLIKNDTIVSTWITKLFEQLPIPQEVKDDLQQDDKTPKKLKLAKYTELTFAAKIEDDQLQVLNENDSLIFTYLPTKVRRFRFPFLINGSFLTSASREDIHEDRYWNQWLMKLTGEKLIQWLGELGNTKFQYQILQLLPALSNEVHGTLKSNFISSVIRSATENAFVPSISGIKKPCELVIDKTGLSNLDFLTADTVINFINKVESKKYTSGSFVHFKLKYTEKLHYLGTSVFNIEHLETFFLSGEFKADHKPEQNFRLIEYFNKLSTDDHTGDLKLRLKEIPFLYDADNELKKPIAICFPSVAYTTEFGGSVKFLNEIVYTKIVDDPKIKTWLEDLGVKEPSDLAYLENELIANISTCINNNNFLEITRYLFSQYKKGALKTDHLLELRQLRLFTVNEQFVTAEQCYLADFYQPVLKLEKLMSDLDYVSSKYWLPGDQITAWKLFLLEIGVVENVQQQTIKSNYAGMLAKYPNFSQFFNQYRTQAYDASSINQRFYNPILEYSITTYSLFEFSTDYKFSKMFWDSVLKEDFKRVQKDRGSAQYHNTSLLPESFFEWCLKNCEIFPTTQDNCGLASNVFINDKDIVEIAGKFLPVFDYEQPLSEHWKALIPFKKTLKLEDYLDIIDLMAKDYADDKPITKSDQKKMMLVYNKLLDIMPNLSSEKKQFIRDWGLLGKLPASNLKFEHVTGLRHVNVVGFNNSSEKLKILLLPQGLRVGTNEFDELLGLLNIYTINQFMPSFGNELPEIAIAFKSKLYSILPHLAALMEKKRFEDFSQEYLRLSEVVVNTHFCSAKEINLTFIHEDEIIIGSSLYAFKANSSFYFKGRWNSPLTMFFLIQELNALLDAKGLNDDLRLLLELNDNEIAEYFTDLGIDMERSEFKIRKVFHELSPQLSTDEENIVEILEETSSNFTEIEMEESFTPNYTALNINTKNIKPVRKSYEGIISLNNDVEFLQIKDEGVRTKIGEWSEQLVFEYLKNESAFTNINWVNESEESFLPYDISAFDGGNEIFIDVKGTPSSTKDVVYLSGKEWEFMMDKAEYYSLYRVYNAGELDAKIEIVGNVRQLMLSGKIIPYKISLQI